MPAIAIPWTPTRRLAIVVVATAPLWLLAAVGAGAVPVVVLAGIAIACLVDIALTPARGSLIVDRAAGGAVGVGDRSKGSYVIRSTWPRPAIGSLYDVLPRAVEREGGALPFTVGPHAETVVPMSIVGRDRGDWPLGPVVLRLRGPFGLIDRVIRHHLSDRVTVIPSIADLRRYELRSLQVRLRDVGLRVLRRRGEGTSFAGLRDYVVGDDPRHVDWKATARRRRLVSREYSIEQGQTIMLMIDAGRLMTQLAGALPRFEYALSSALVLSNVAVRSGDHVGLLLFDDEVRAYIPPARGLSALRRIRDTLVPAQATMTEPDYAAAFRTLATRVSRRSLLVIFTDIIDVRASRALLALTTRGARTHLPLIVALRNDALVAAAAPGGRSTTTALYESAAAEELLSARDEAIERMRRAGVSVLDIKPQTMTAAVINRYLEIKGRGVL